MLDPIFGPQFQSAAPPAASQFRLIVAKDGPRIVLDGNDGEGSELWLPPGWLYEFIPGVSHRGADLRIWWFQDGDPAAVQLSADETYLLVTSQAGVFTVNLPTPTSLRVEVRTDAPDPFPAETLVLAPNPSGNQLPVAACTPQFLPALLPERCRTELVSAQGSSIQVQVKSAFVNGCSATRTLPAREVQNSDRDASPILGVWPAQLRERWRLHRIYADVGIQLNQPNLDQSAIRVGLLEGVTANRTADGRETRLRSTSSVHGSQGLHAITALGTPLLKDRRSAVLLHAPEQARELYWLISHGDDGTNAGRHALFRANVRRPERQSLLEHDKTHGTIAGAKTLGVDFGTSTTTLAGLCAGKPVPFRIDPDVGHWQVAWAGSASPEGGQTTVGWWLPWVLPQVIAGNLKSGLSEFPSVLHVWGTPCDVWPDVAATLRIQGGGKHVEHPVTATLVRREAAFKPLDPNASAFDERLGESTLPGAMKWRASTSPAYAAAREAYLEQVLLFALHEIAAVPIAEAVKVRATCPARFSTEERESYAEALIRVLSSLQRFTGLQLDLEEKPVRDATKAQVALSLQDEAQPLLQYVVQHALDGGDDDAVVVVADLGGETLDVGLYARVHENGTSYAEVFADSVRCGGESALRHAFLQDRKDNDRAYNVGWTVREHGAAAMSPHGNRESEGYRSFSKLCGDDRLETARTKLLAHQVAVATAVRSFLVDAPRELGAARDHLDAEASGAMRLDRHLFAKSQSVQIESEAKFRERWVSNSKARWTRVSSRLVAMVSGQGQPPQYDAPRPRPAATAPLPPQRPGPDLATLVNRLRDIIESSGEEATVKASWVLSKLAVASVTTERTAPTEAEVPRALTASAEPRTGVRVSGKLIVYLAGNGWRLTEACGLTAKEVVRRVLGGDIATVYGDVVVIQGAKPDAVEGSLLAVAPALFRRYDEHDRLTPLAPHGVRIGQGRDGDPTVYEPRHGSAHVRRLREALRDESPVFAMRPELTAHFSTVRGHSDESGAVVEVEVGLSCEVGTATRDRLREWVRMEPPTEALNAAQKLMLEAYYRGDT